MSTKTQPVESEATNEELNEFLDSPKTTAPEKPKKKKNVLYRLLALVLAIVPIVVYLFLNTAIIVSEEGGYVLHKDIKLLDIFLYLFGVKEGSPFQHGSLVFGIVPITTAEGGVAGYVSNSIMYALPVAMLISIICAIIALFSGKAAPKVTRLILFLNFWVYFLYAIVFAFTDVYVGGDLLQSIDYTALIVAGVCFLFYLIISLIKVGGRAIFGLLIFLISAASVGAIVYALLTDPATTKALIAQNIVYEWIGLGILGVYAICLMIAMRGISAKKLYGADLLRCIIMMLLGGFVVYLALTNKTVEHYFLFGAIATGIAFLLMVIEIIVLTVKAKKNNVPEEATEELPADDSNEETTAETPAEEPTVEEVVEAVAIEEEVPAQEVTAPVEEPAPVQETPAPVQETPAPQQESLGDPFLLTLSAEEKAQFVSLFILKSKGELGLPEYKYGADNTKFFRKIFVNLGMLRAKIPDGLMYKIYKFVTKE